MRVNLDKALDRWRERGIIDEDAATAIRTFETGQRKPFFAWAAYILGGFAITIGIVALVAANWSAIPATAKLVAHFSLSLAVGIALIAVQARSFRVATELLSLIGFGLTLSLIALIGQIYQIQSPLWVGLTTWLVLGSPIILVFARGAFVIAIWLLALQVAVGSLGEPLADWLSDQQWIGPHWPAIAVAIYGTYLAGLLAVGGIIPGRPETATMKRLIIGISLVLIVLAASASQFIWYVGAERTSEMGSLPARLLSSVWLAGVGAAAWATVRRAMDANQRRTLAIVMASCIAIGVVPYLFAPVEFRVAAVVLQIGLWAVIGWAGVVSGMVWVGRLAIGLIALRLLIVYAEVFGTLIQTGLGLIVSGLVVVATTFVAVRAQARLARGGGNSA